MSSSRTDLETLTDSQLWEALQRAKKDKATQQASVAAACEAIEAINRELHRRADEPYKG